MIKWFDNAPFWLKIVLALPFVDIAWAIYRIVKGVQKKDYLLLVIGILWILLGWLALWLVDIITIAINKRPVLS